MSMDTEASLREYLKLQLRIPVVGRIGPLAKAFDFVATAAPGVREILTVGKLCWEVRESHYDLVVVDAPASGHIIGQLAAPQAINDLVKVGLIRSQTDWMLDILSDPGQTGLVAVCTPEEMPVSETLELATRVREETTVRMSAVVVNRVLPELFGQREEEIFEQLRAPDVERVLSERAAGTVTPVLEAARLAVTMRRTRSAHLQRLQAGLARRAPGAPAAVPVRRAASGRGRPARWRAPSARSSDCDGGLGRRRQDGRAAARRQGHRHRLRAGRSGQDHHRGGARRHGRRRAGRPGPGAHRRPGRAGWPTPWG